MDGESVVTRLLAVYDLATAGNASAYQFLQNWHGWCHAIDDAVDQDADAGGVDVIGLCADAAAVFSGEFYQAHAGVLRPVVAVVAEKFRASLGGGALDPLRFAGNDMVLLVAALCGGRDLVRLVSEQLWPLVIETQVEA